MDIAVVCLCFRIAFMVEFEGGVRGRLIQVDL